MKRFLIITGIVVFLFLGALVAIPIIFKDDIQKMVDNQIDKNLNAKVYYDVNSFSLSLISHFPDLSIGLGNFGIVGKEPFAGDTLAHVDNFELSFNLWSVIDGKPRITGLYLDQPRIQVKVLEDGAANYDIAVASEDTVTQEEDTAASQMKIGVDHWEINNGYFVYDDRSLPYRLSLKGVNHTGNGDFTMSVFDMVTQTSAESVTMSYDGVEYLTDKTLNADVTMNMNLDQFKFTFKDNKVTLNDFPLGFDGYFAMPDNGYEMDLNFEAKETSFKTLLSLVPGAYIENFDQVKTAGSIQFKGAVAGLYNEENMPGFELTTLIENASFQYPDLPSKVENIGMDLHVDNKSGNLDEMLVNLKTFHMDMGPNPIDATFKMDGMNPYNLKADAKADINLASLNKMLPMEGLSLEGQYKLDLKADGVYDTVNSTIPNIDMTMALRNGLVDYSEAPEPLKNISVDAKVINNSGKMENTEVNVSRFAMSMAGEKISGDLKLTNLNDYTWDFNLEGAMDLKKVMALYPVEGTEVSGKVNANLHSKGKMSMVEAENYQALETSGTLTLNNFKFASKDVPQPVGISSAKVTFNPQSVNLNNFQGTLGKSDLYMEGFISNYLNYALKGDVIKGQLSLRSDKMDLNEWMADEAEETPEDTAESAPIEVVKIPENIDFVMNSSIKQLTYDNLDINNFRGEILVRGGVLKLNGVNFNTLDGQFGMMGTYDTRIIEEPEFDFDLDIKNLAISKAYENFVTVKKLAPIAKNMDGSFSTDFKIAGILKEDMSPDMNTLNGRGIIELNDAAVKNSKLIGAVTKVSKLKEASGAQLSDVKLDAEIKDGRVHVKPFDFKVAGYKTRLSGSQGIDGTLDFDMMVNVPTGKAGKAASDLISQYTGLSADASEVNLNFNVAGTSNDPKVNMTGAKAAGSEKQGSSVKMQVKDKADQKKEEAKQAVEEKKKEVKEKAEKKVDETKEKVKQEADKKKEEVKEKAKEKKEDAKKKAKDKLNDIF